MTFEANLPAGDDHDGLEMFDAQTYLFPGPVAENFFIDRSFISFLQGPYGSGKTTVCFFKLLDRAIAMPKCKDGVRRYRALVLRDTYRRMERTAIRSWHKWFPASVGKWEGGQDRPSKHKINLELLDGILEFEIEFAAVGDLDVEDFFGGYEITDLFLNEANLQTQEALTYGAGRCGRFPSMKDLPPGSKFEYGVIGDLNAPEFDSWLLNMQFGELDASMAALGKTAFFVQPGGRSPQAENVQNLPEFYYDRLAAANAHQPWWVARMIDNKPGFSRHGKPVFDEYDDGKHCAAHPFAIMPGVALEFGLDGGGHPAAVVGQRSADGQMRIIREFYLGRCGPTRFGEAIERWLLGPAKGVPVAKRNYADPTAFDGVDKASGEMGFIEIIQNVTGLRFEPAPSNEPDIRLDAVRQELLYSIDGSHPALVISPECKALRKGFASDYRFSKIRKETGEELSERPVKNEASNPQDALQYLMLGSRGKIAVERRQHGARPSSPAGVPQSINTNFSVF
jgi:hypothetical protein